MSKTIRTSKNKMNSKQHATNVRCSLSPLDYDCGFCARQHANLQCPNIAFTLRDPVTEQITFYLRTEPKGFVPAYKKYIVLDTTAYTVAEMMKKVEDYSSSPELFPRLFLDRSCTEREKYKCEMKKKEELSTAATTSKLPCSTAAQCTAQKEASKRKNKRQKKISRAKKMDGVRCSVAVVTLDTLTEFSTSPSLSFTSTIAEGAWSPIPNIGRVASRATIPSVTSKQDLEVPDVEDAQPEDAETKQQGTEEMEDKVLFGIEQALQMRLRMWQDLDLDEA